MGIRINGSLAPIKQETRVSYDPSRGIQVAIPWESAGDNLQGLAGNYLAQRISYDFVSSARKSTLVATASGGQLGIPDLTTDTWQILANEIQKDVKEHPAFLAMEQSFPGTIGYVVRDLELYNQGLPASQPTPPAGAAATALLLLGLLLRGTTHFAVGQYALKHTTNVSNVYGVNVSDVNVERTYTTAQLLAEVTNGLSWTFPMPARLVYKIQAIAAPTAHTNYLWGWRKLPSTETTTAGNRVEISTEYWLDEWHTTLYPAAI